MSDTDDKSKPAFATLDEAIKWMDEQVDDPCIDNRRHAHVDDAAEMAEYKAAKDSGCCGSFDEEVIVAGRVMTIGCNYGH